jgi:hypothetical protein
MPVNHLRSHKLPQVPEPSLKRDIKPSRAIEPQLFFFRLTVVESRTASAWYKVVFNGFQECTKGAFLGVLATERADTQVSERKLPV